MGNLVVFGIVFLLSAFAFILLACVVVVIFNTLLHGIDVDKETKMK